MAHYLISQEYLAERSLLDDNIDFKKTAIVIGEVQDLKIKPLLGDDLYNRIVAETTPPTIPSNAVKYLLDNYILKIMGNYIAAGSTDVLKYRFMNKGVLSKNPDGATNTDLSELRYLVDKFNTVAQSYTELMLKYIISSGNYPEYYTGAGMTPSDAFEIDIYLPNGED